MLASLAGTGSAIVLQSWALSDSCGSILLGEFLQRSVDFWIYILPIVALTYLEDKDADAVIHWVAERLPSAVLAAQP